MNTVYVFTPPTPTKGRILAGDGVRWVPVDVGADDEVLTADSTATEGVTFKPAPAAPAAATTSHPVPLTDGDPDDPQILFTPDGQVLLGMVDV